MKVQAINTMAHLKMHLFHMRLESLLALIQFEKQTFLQVFDIDIPIVQSKMVLKYLEGLLVGFSGSKTSKPTTT